MLIQRFLPRTVPLLLIVIFLTGLAVWEAIRPWEDDVPTQQAPLDPTGDMAASVDRSAPTRGQNIAAWGQDVLAQPLFRMTRRPTAVITDNGADGDLPRLAGIVTMRGARFAVFHRPGEAAPILLGEGALIGSSRIIAIGRYKVRIVTSQGMMDIKPQLQNIAPSSTSDRMTSDPAGTSDRTSTFDPPPNGVAPQSGSVSSSGEPALPAVPPLPASAASSSP